MLVTKKAKAIYHAQESDSPERIKVQRDRVKSKQRRRIRESLEEMKDLYNSGKANEDDFDIQHEKEVVGSAMGWF